MTFEEVLKAAVDKGYQPFLPDGVPKDTEARAVFEIPFIMIWLDIKHKSPVPPITVYQHRIGRNTNGVLTTIHDAILKLN